MTRPVLTGLAFGGALFTALIVWFGSAEILTAMAAVCWGVLLVSGFRFFLLIFDTASWWVLLPPGKRGTIGWLFWIRWIGDSVNTLLPVARIGGEFLRAHMAARRGIDGPLAGASVMVDVTAGIATQFLFSVVGVAAFFYLASGGANTNHSLVIGLAAFGAGLAGFYFVQRAGPFERLARLSERIGRGWGSLADDAVALDAAVQAMYRERRAVLACCFWRIVGWVAGTGEVWLILHLAGHPISLTEAFVLESLGQAARSAGFMIPGGLGIQEGGLILVGGQLGLAAETALALSLVKRARELLIGVPGLIAWQIDVGLGLGKDRRT
jgi:putative membrane protein